MRRDKLGGDPLPHQGKYSGSFKFIAISVGSMLHAIYIYLNMIKIPKILPCMPSFSWK
jgi:hypothetical protein